MFWKQLANFLNPLISLHSALFIHRLITFILPQYMTKSTLIFLVTNLSHSIIFLYIFIYFCTVHLRRPFISPCYCLELCIQLGISFPFSLCLLLLFFFSYFWRLLRQPLCFLHFFLFGVVLVIASCTMSWTSIYSSSGTLSTRSNPLSLFVTSSV